MVSSQVRRSMRQGKRVVCDPGHRSVVGEPRHPCADRMVFLACFLPKQNPSRIFDRVSAASYDCDWAALMSCLACLAFLLSALAFTLGSSC